MGSARGGASEGTRYPFEGEEKDQDENNQVCHRMEKMLSGPAKRRCPTFGNLLDANIHNERRWGHQKKPGSTKSIDEQQLYWQKD